MRKSGWTTKPSTAKKPLTELLESEIAAYNEQVKALSEFKEEYAEFVEAYQDLMVSVSEAKTSLDQASREIKLSSGIHPVSDFSDGTTLAIDVVKQRRSVDSQILIDHPHLASFKGLVTVKVGALDSVVAAKLLTKKQIKKYIVGEGEMTSRILWSDTVRGE